MERSEERSARKVQKKTREVRELTARLERDIASLQMQIKAKSEKLGLEFNPPMKIQKKAPVRPPPDAAALRTMSASVKEILSQFTQ